MRKSLRKWQIEALKTYQDKKSKNLKSILWEATPGSGKTVAAINLCLQELKSKSASKVVIIVPTTHLKLQWARTASEYKLDLDFNFGDKKGVLSRDFIGAVLTYQQVGHQPRRFANLAQRAVVVLDEVHHAGEGLTWGNALKLALKDSSFILCLSGTAFRSDNNPIPFVTYNTQGVSEPDYVYSYSHAIEDRVCRPTVFFTYGGDVAWQDNSDSVSVNFNDSLERVGRTRRLKAALDPESGWIEPMLKDADAMLQAIRHEHPEAGGLLVAANQRNARSLASVIRRVTGEMPTTVLSEDPAANKKLKDFTAGQGRWLVACNMVSEGVDIPRLRVGVFATTVRTKMYFRQFLGRIVRKTSLPKGLQTAFFYLPADPWLKNLAEEIEKEQKHYLKNVDEDIWPDLGEEIERKPKEDKQVTWQALKSTNSGIDSIISSGGQLSLWGQSNESDNAYIENFKPDYIEKAPIKLTDGVALTKSELKEEIAKEIRTLVTRYHHTTGKPHSHIHSLLNRSQSVSNQKQCTEKQLRERLNILEEMIHKT